MELLLKIATVLTELFVLALGLGVMFVIAMYVVDRTQTRHSLSPQFSCAGPFSLSI